MLITRVSQISGETHQKDLPVTEEQMAAFESGVLIQFAFPHLNDDDREFILSGITPEEWAECVGDEREGDFDPYEDEPSF